MTEATEKWIQSEAADFAGAEYTQDIFICGLTKGIEIAEEFPEWADDERYIWDRKKRKYVASWDNYSEFTTSQLLEKYLETLNKQKS